MASYFDKVKKILVEILNIDERMVTAESSVKHDLGVDSMDTIDIIMALEKEFDIDIDETHLDQFKKVQDYVVYIETNK